MRRLALVVLVALALSTPGCTVAGTGVGAESTGLQGFRKQVAIKRVLPHLGRKSKFISMFLDEARLSAQLSHSNCVQVFDIGEGDGAYFIVMEFVDGANLKSIATSMRNQGRTFPIAAGVAAGG